jgi:hypothetical protein
MMKLHSGYCHTAADLTNGDPDFISGNGGKKFFGRITGGAGQILGQAADK